MTLRRQAASLAIMHGFEVLQPLLILPYAARILGPYQLGKFAYAMSIGQFAVTFVAYGFHWTAQRTAASVRREPTAIASLFADVVATQTVLLLAITVVGLAIADSVLPISRPLLLCAILTAAGGMLFPAWLFIGLERAWQVAVAVVVARCLAFVCFVTLVTSPTQVVLAVAIQSAIPLVSAIVSVPFILPIGFGGFRFLSLARVKLQLRSGWNGFLYTLVERTLLTLPVPLVEHFSGYVTVGYYSIAEKFVSATRSVFRVMTETLLPRVAYYAHHDPGAGISLIRRSLLTLGIGAALSFCLFFIAPPIIILFFGDTFAPAISIVRAMAVIPFLLNGNICMSNLYMFNYGYERAWARLSVAGLLVFVIVAYLLSPHFANAAMAVAIALVAKEAVVFLVSAAFFLNISTILPPRVLRARASILAGTVSLSPTPAAQPRQDQIPL
jgi:O-antigen/teichoic acid export membrane protein